MDYRQIITPRAMQCFRDSHGVSTAEIARMLGVNPATVSRWEDDARRKGPEGTAALLFAAMLIRSGCAEVSPVLEASVLGRVRTLLESVGTILAMD